MAKKVNWVVELSEFVNGKNIKPNGQKVKDVTELKGAKLTEKVKSIIANYEQAYNDALFDKNRLQSELKIAKESISSLRTKADIAEKKVDALKRDLVKELGEKNKLNNNLNNIRNVVESVDNKLGWVCKTFCSKAQEVIKMIKSFL